MSLSNPSNNSNNPVKKFIEWKGGEGYFRYWDKEASKEVKLNEPFYFIVLDQRASIKGYSDKHNNGIYSNEVKNIMEDEFKVYCDSKLIVEGPYNQIKGTLSNEGGKYCKAVYAALIIPKGKGEKPDLELVKFELYGSSIGKWIDLKVDEKFIQKANVICYDGEKEEGKKGSVTYFEPIYKVKDSRKDILQDAIDLDVQLQNYFSGGVEEKEEDEVKEEVNTFVEQDDDALPF